MSVMMRQCIGFLGFGLLVLLNGCSTARSHSWSNPEYESHSLGKTAVMATFEDEYLSGEFEATFAQRLRDFVPAVSLRSAVENFGALDKDQVENLLTENRVNTLVVVRRVSSTGCSQLVPYGVSYQTTIGQSGSCYTYCSSFQLDETVASFTDNTVETSIFDVASGELMWSGMKEVYDFNSKASNMERVIDEAVWALEETGMLKATMVY